MPDAKKASELTRSPFWKEVYTLQEESAVRPGFHDFDERLSQLSDKLKELLSDTEDKFDRLPDNFKTDDKQQKCEDRKEALETAIEAIDGIDTDYDGKDDDIARQEWVDEQWQDAVDALNNISCD